MTGAQPMTVFALLWGVPFLVQGQGLTTGQAAGLLALTPIASVIAAPIMGDFASRHPLRRTWVVLAGAALTTVAWGLVLVPSTPRPYWQLVVFVLLLSAGGPSSMIGLDLAASFNVPQRRGTATGVANMGGPASSVVAMLAIGVVLDRLAPDGHPSLADYRIAMALCLALALVGVAGVLLTRQRVRAAAGIVVPTFAELRERRGVDRADAVRRPRSRQRRNR
jgi:MFS family permease